MRGQHHGLDAVNAFDTLVDRAPDSSKNQFGQIEGFIAPPDVECDLFDEDLGSGISQAVLREVR